MRLIRFALCSFVLSVSIVASGQAPGDGPPPPPAAPTHLTAVGWSTTHIQLSWTDNSDNETSFRIEKKINGTFVQIGYASINATQVKLPEFAAGESGTFRIRASNAGGDSAYSNEATGAANSIPGACTPSPTVVCLLNNRFKVKVDYVNPFSNPPDQPGTFLAARLLEGVQNPDTALFGFANAQAVEVVVRLQDTRPFAPRFDVYLGGLTDVGYTVSVTDSTTGVTRLYSNQAGRIGGAVDRLSFSTN